MPPEAEPVMPASTLVATAVDTSGFDEMPSTASRITPNAGSDAIVAPYPTSEAVLNPAAASPWCPC